MTRREGMRMDGKKRKGNIGEAMRREEKGRDENGSKEMRWEDMKPVYDLMWDKVEESEMERA